MIKRNRIIAVRLSENEYAHLKEQVAKCTLKLEPMLRNMIAGLELYVRPCDHHQDLLKALCTITNDVAEILRTMRATGQISESDDCLLKKLINDCWQEIHIKF